MNFLQLIKRVKYSLGLDVSGMGFGRVGKKTNAFTLPVCLNIGLPLAPVDVPANTKISTFIVRPRSASILLVFGASGSPKIGKPVIPLIPIDMVNLAIWHNSMGINERQSVSVMQRFIDHYADVFSLNRPGDQIFTSARRIFAPREYPGVRVLVEKFAQAFSRYNWFSHDTGLSLIGQRLASVSALGGLCYFNA